MTAWSMLLIFFFSVCVFLLSLYFSGSVNTYLQSSAPLIFRHYVQKEKKKRHFFKCAVFLFFFLSAALWYLTSYLNAADCKEARSTVVKVLTSFFFF